MITKVRKKIYYRMATFEGVDASITLQSLLKKILESGVGSRQQQLNPDEKTFRAINQHAECQGMTCCQVIQVDPNAYQPVMIYDSGTPEEYRIDAVSTTELGKLFKNPRAKPDGTKMFCSAFLNDARMCCFFANAIVKY